MEGRAMFHLHFTQRRSSNLRKNRDNEWENCTELSLAFHLNNRRLDGRLHWSGLTTGSVSSPSHSNCARLSLYRAISILVVSGGDCLICLTQMECHALEPTFNASQLPNNIHVFTRPSLFVIISIWRHVIDGFLNFKQTNILKNLRDKNPSNISDTASRLLKKVWWSFSNVNAPKMD